PLRSVVPVHRRAVDQGRRPRLISGRTSRSAGRPWPRWPRATTGGAWPGSAAAGRHRSCRDRPAGRTRRRGPRRRTRSCRRSLAESIGVAPMEQAASRREAVAFLVLLARAARAWFVAADLGLGDDRALALAGPPAGQRRVERLDHDLGRLDDRRRGLRG